MWVYRAVLLDFFWAKQKFQAKAMTGLVKSFNLVARKGPLSITTDVKEYLRRFLGMVEELLKDEGQVRASGSSSVNKASEAQE